MEEYVHILSSPDERLIDQITLLFEREAIPTLKRYAHSISLYISRDYFERACMVIGAMAQRDNTLSSVF